MESSVTDLHELKIQNLRSSNSQYLVSGFLFPSFGAVLEELVTNALDAQARKIEILLDTAKLDVQVIDDGRSLLVCLNCFIRLVFCSLGAGIDEADMRNVGNWHYAEMSKANSRGQSLAALRTMSKSVEIVSKSSKGDRSWVKFMTAQEEELKSLSDPTPTGTIVTVKRVFHSFPVRRSAINVDVELSSIRDFVEKLSILHHDVTWTLRDARYQRILFHTVGQSSVLKRLLDIYGSEVVDKMQSVCFSNDKFQLEGFLSPPTPFHCQSNQRMQLIYYNNQWIKSKDPLSGVLNKCYSDYFRSPSEITVPVAMHAIRSDTSNSHQKYPCFVLKLTFSHSDVNLIRDGDRTIPVFVHESLFESFIMESLSKLYAKEYPEFSQSLLLKQKRKSGGQVCNLFSANERLFSTIESSRRKRQSERRDYDELALDGSLFSFAFLPVTSDNNTSANKREKEIVLDFTIDKEIQFERAPSRDTEIQLRAPTSGPSAHILLPLPKSGISNSSPSNPATRSKRRKSSEMFFESKNEVVDRLLHSYQLSPVEESSIERSIALEKSFLFDLKVIGQWDQKYILAFDESSGKLVAFDQHAVDERIKYENLVNEPIHSNPLAKPLVVALDESMRLVLETRKDLFNAWGFEYLFIDSVDDVGDDNQCFMRVTSLPNIVEELLTIDDLKEFCHFVEANINLPDSALQPPVIKRILAYKACRAAVKFGDTLTTEQSTNLICQLASTKLPFQCAHGRPSLIPLADLHHLL